MNKDIKAYNERLSPPDKEICELLSEEITSVLKEAESKIWHGHPVWFLEGNPIVGYSKEKRGLRLMFWSGQSFEEDELMVRGEKFKDASIFYNSAEEVNSKTLRRWLKKAKDVQWDYRNIVKHRGVLEKLK